MGYTMTDPILTGKIRHIGIKGVFGVPDTIPEIVFPEGMQVDKMLLRLRNNNFGYLYIKSGLISSWWVLIIRDDGRWEPKFRVAVSAARNIKAEKECPS